MQAAATMTFQIRYSRSIAAISEGSCGMSSAPVYSSVGVAF